MNEFGVTSGAIVAAMLENDISLDVARTVMAWIDEGHACGDAQKAWTRIYREVLTTAHDFSLHLALYEACYQVNSSSSLLGAAWLPSPEIVGRANVTSSAVELGLGDYRDFHRWSVEHREDYWHDVINRLGIRFRRRYDQIVDSQHATRPRWLPGAKLNIVESCFQADPDATAIVEATPGGNTRRWTYADLERLTARVANGLVASGVAPGESIGVVMPLTPAAVAIYLGIIAAGAVVVPVPDSFAAEEIALRLRIAGVQRVFTQDVVYWGDRRLSLHDRVAAATSLPTVVVRIDKDECALRDGATEFESFLSKNERLSCLATGPHEAINVLFSSGTTAEPKAIPWDHTTPIKCGADAHFHQDIHAGDVVCWPTSLGWMMGPWLIFATLLNRATMALYSQTPAERAFGEFVQNANVTLLGLVPTLVRGWRQSECMQGLDWSNIRAFSSTGECSNPTDMLYLMHLAGYRPVVEYCGGTEIGGGYVTGTVVQPCVPSTFTTPALGLDFVLLEDERTSAKGEVYIEGPSIGLSTRLLNRDHDETYYGGTPLGESGRPLRRHGDELERLEGGYFRVVGRCDDTMNLGGIKVGCAEIERVLNQVAGVCETAAVAVPARGGGPSRLVVFLVPARGEGSSAESFQHRLQDAIRNELNPLFRIDTVRLVEALPRTASNKVMRRELRARCRE